MDYLQTFDQQETQCATITKSPMNTIGSARSM
jgi:hypothetical protein